MPRCPSTASRCNSERLVVSTKLSCQRLGSRSAATSVKQHRGSIEVDTQPDEFAEIKVILPRAAALLPERSSMSVMAQSGHPKLHRTCPLWGVKRTWVDALQM